MAQAVATVVACVLAFLVELSLSAESSFHCPNAHDLRSSHRSVSPSLIPMVQVEPMLRLRGGHRSERKSKGHHGKGGDRGNRRAPGRGRGGPEKSDEGSRRTASESRKVSEPVPAFQSAPPTLETLLDDPAVKDFATNLFSNPGFQAIASSMLENEQNFEMLKSCAGINETYTQHDKDQLNRVLGALAVMGDSNISSVDANASSLSNATESSNQSANQTHSLEEADMPAMMDAMGTAARGAMAAQWTHAKEKQMQENPSLAGLQDSPKVQEMQAEIAAHGPMAALKYVNDPEALATIQKIIGVAMQ